MLESRSAYGWYGAAGGSTGENAPNDIRSIERRMPYYKFKRDYPNCDHYGYDPTDKSIVVLIPEERQSCANFGNHYRMSRFYFWVYDEYAKRFCIVDQDAKTAENAEKHIKAWTNRTQRGEHGAIRFAFIRQATLDESNKFNNKMLAVDEFASL